MYNLKKGKGTYKGLIGECMFKLTRRYLVLTQFWNKNKYFDTFGDKLSREQKEFIDKNWYSVDGIEFDYSKRPPKAMLFEIKTMNKKINPKPHWINKMTLATHKMYNDAIKIRFDVRIVTVLLLDDWNYEIKITDFSKAKYYIDKPRKYDKK